MDVSELKASDKEKLKWAIQKGADALAALRAARGKAENCRAAMAENVQSARA